MVTDVWVVTELVATANLALMTPAGTVTLAGTVAADVLLLESVTTAPPLGAVPLRVTKPLEGTPALTVVGLNAIEDSVREAGGGPPGVPGLELELELELEPHEYKASENVTRPSAAARPRPGCVAMPKWERVAQTRSPAIHAAIQPNRAEVPEDGAIPMNPAGAAARAVVCTVTVAVTGLAPLSVSAGGTMVQEDAAGSPPHVKATV